MTNEEIVQEISDVLKMNQRAAMTPEQIAVQQRANELVLRIGRIGDDETMSPIFYEALMNERRIAIEEERDGCAAIAKAVKERWEEATKSGIGFNKDIRNSRSLTAQEIEFRIRGRDPEWSVS